MIGAREIIGIQIGATKLKVAYVRVQAHKREVVKLVSHSIKDVPDEEIARKLKETISSIKAKKAQYIAIVTLGNVITKNIEIPSTSPSEIKSIIDLQAGRHTPYSREEIIADYIDIGPFKQSYTKILLIIITRDIIKRQFDILSKCGIRLQRIAFSLEALAKYVTKILRLDTSTGPVSVVHIAESASDFSVVYREKPIFARNIPIGSSHLLNDKEKYSQRFVEEIKRSLEAYKNEDIEKSPKAIFITGSTEEIKELVSVLNANLHIPSKAVSCFKNVALSSEVTSRAGEINKEYYLDTIAPLFFAEELKADLIPEEAKLSKEVEERGKELILTGMLILTTFVLIFITLLSKIYFKSTFLENLTAKYGDVAKEASTLEKDFSKMSFIKNYMSKRGYSLEVISELYEVATYTLKISEIKYDSEGELSIKGTAESMATVFTFVDSMEKSDYFKDVKTRYTTKRKDGLRDVTDFDIRANLDKLD